MPLRGALPDGDGLAQTVQQPFQMSHTLAQFGDLLLQGGEPFAEFLTLGDDFPAEFRQFGTEFLTLGGQLPAEFGLFGIEIPTLGGEFGADGSLPAQNQPGQGRSDRKDGYQDADQFNTHGDSP